LELDTFAGGKVIEKIARKAKGLGFCGGLVKKIDKS